MIKENTRFSKFFLGCCVLTVAGSLVAPVFADTSQQTNNSLLGQIITGEAHTNPFSGAFFEIDGGLANKGKPSSYNWNNTTNYTVSFAGNDVAGNRNPAVDRTVNGTLTSSDSSRGSSSTEGALRLSLGYGLNFGSFNFTPSLFYMPNSFSLGSGVTLKNTRGIQMQPGYYLPLTSQKYLKGLLFYGTLGFAQASLDRTFSAPEQALCTPDIPQFNVAVQPNFTTFSYPSICQGDFAAARTTTHDTLNGLVLGLGSKLAFSERIYGVFDFTYITYKGKGADSHTTQTQVVDSTGNFGNSHLDGRFNNTFSARYTGNWTRDHNASYGSERINQSFIYLGVGYRFF